MNGVLLFPCMHKCIDVLSWTFEFLDGEVDRVDTECQLDIECGQFRFTVIIGCVVIDNNQTVFSNSCD